jgi:hypothetical protein
MRSGKRFEGAAARPAGLTKGKAQPRNEHPRRRNVPVKELIAALLLWIGQNSDYTNLTAPKYWMELAQEQVDERSRLKTSHRQSGAFAMYECDSQTLILRAGFDFSWTWEQSVLLHELVHHAQCLRNGRYDDLCAAEREAYTLQAKYLRAMAASQVNSGHPDLQRMIAIIEQEPARVCEILRRN